MYLMPEVFIGTCVEIDDQGQGVIKTGFLKYNAYFKCFSEFSLLTLLKF
jgi:uncharacterized protein YcgI (DUF1989 family)